MYINIIQEYYKMQNHQRNSTTCVNEFSASD